jgi:hypothetical protein
MYHEWDSDPKVQSMAEVMQRRLCMLFCLRCKEETLQEHDRAFHWRISPQELAETKSLFMQKGFIDDEWNLLNWDRRQFISDSSTERVRRFREKKANETHETKCNILSTVSLSRRAPLNTHLETGRNVTETPSSVSVSVSESVSVSDKKPSEAEKIYQMYPRHVGKGDAINAIKKTLKSKTSDELLAAVAAFVSQVEIEGRDMQFIPHPATWFNQGRYDDDMTPHPRTNGGNHAKQAGADNQRETSTAESYATWLSMSDEFQKTNPWQGPTE